MSIRSRILVVDDDPAVRHMLLRVLDEENYSVRTARTGSEALELARAESFQLLLLDGDLPKENVGRLCGQFAEAHPDVPMIIMVRAGNSSAPCSSGIGVCLEKPLDMERLVRTVGELIAAVQQPPPRVAPPAPSASASTERPPLNPAWGLKPSPIS